MTRLCKRVAVLKCVFCGKILCMPHAREPCFHTAVNFERHHAFDSVTATCCTVEVGE